MRKLSALVALATAALVTGPAVAADIPDPYIEIPEVDYGLGGSFYLRGSAGFGITWAKEKVDPLNDIVYPIDTVGYGYSWGGGFGYETGTGLRVDATMDSMESTGLHINKDTGGAPDDGDYYLMLRSTVALANVYYDFGFGGDGFGYTGTGGAFGYVGAGIGAAWNHAEVNSQTNAIVPVPTGTNISAAAAAMAGVGYDMGNWVADLGYRAVWIQQVNNSPTAQDVDSYYYINNHWTHELRGTVRYRFN